MKIFLLFTIAIVIAATIVANSGAGTTLFHFVQFLPGKDLTAHFLLYGILGLLVLTCIHRTEQRSLKTNLG